jgi:hypothetical protein
MEIRNKRSQIKLKFKNPKAEFDPPIWNIVVIPFIDVFNLFRISDRYSGFLS